MKTKQLKFNERSFSKRMIKICLVVFCAGTMFYSCKKKHYDVAPAAPTSTTVKDTILTGFIKGTLVAGTTYHVTGDIYIKHTDTLVVQPGVTVIVKGDVPAASDPNAVSYAIHNSGTLICNGTKGSPITFKPSAANPTLVPGGYWGGIQNDSSAKFVSMTWTNLSYTGGPDVAGGNQYAFSVVGVNPSGNNSNFQSNTKVILENCTFLNGIDDCIRLTGPIQVSVKGNVIRHEGSTDGDNINIKLGVTGDVAYNYIFSSANNGIKLETSPTVLYPQTHINIYNNTIVNGGWRKQGEFTAGILVDKFSQASVYNNMIVNCHGGLRITKAADTTFIKSVNAGYGSNYFYTAIDSVRVNFYPPTDWSKPRGTDIISTSVSNKNPMFVALNNNVFADVDINDAHLQASSPAKNAGNINAPYHTDLGTPMMPGKDIGCFQTDGSGNQH